MRVTGLRRDKRAPGRLVVEVDGARFATLSAEAVQSLGIARGRDLGEEESQRLRYMADVEGAYRVAVRLLAVRPRAVNELLRRLRDRGHNPSAAAEAVGRLEAQGLLDDDAFAQHFVRARSARGHGPARLLTDLLVRGVDRRLAQRAIDQVLDSEGVDPLAQARAIALKRSAQLGELPWQKKRRRLVGYLSRRGFRGREVIEMVGEVIGEE